MDNKMDRAMEEFNLDNQSRKMPYAPLSEGYFEEFNASMLSRIEEGERVEHRRWSLLFSSSMAIAASIAVVLTFLLFESPTQRAINSFDSSLDLYVERLSDEELDSYYVTAEVVDDFYANLTVEN